MRGVPPLAFIELDADALQALYVKTQELVAEDLLGGETFIALQNLNNWVRAALQHEGVETDV